MNMDDANDLPPPPRVHEPDPGQDDGCIPFDGIRIPVLPPNPDPDPIPGPPPGSNPRHDEFLDSLKDRSWSQLNDKEQKQVSKLTSKFGSAVVPQHIWRKLQTEKEAQAFQAKRS